MLKDKSELIVQVNEIINKEGIDKKSVPNILYLLPEHDAVAIGFEFIEHIFWLLDGFDEKERLITHVQKAKQYFQENVPLSQIGELRNETIDLSKSLSRKQIFSEVWDAIDCLTFCIRFRDVFKHQIRIVLGESYKAYLVRIVRNITQAIFLYHIQAAKTATESYIKEQAQARAKLASQEELNWQVSRILAKIKE